MGQAFEAASPEGEGLDPGGDDRDGPQPRPPRRRRGRRDGGAPRGAAQPRLRHRSGLPVQPPDRGRGDRAADGPLALPAGRTRARSAQRSGPARAKPARRAPAPHRARFDLPGRHRHQVRCRAHRRRAQHRRPGDPRGADHSLVGHGLPTLPRPGSRVHRGRPERLRRQPRRPRPRAAELCGGPAPRRIGNGHRHALRDERAAASRWGRPRCGSWRASRISSPRRGEPASREERRRGRSAQPLGARRWPPSRSWRRRARR